MFDTKGYYPTYYHNHFSGSLRPVLTVDTRLMFYKCIVYRCTKL